MNDAVGLRELVSARRITALPVAGMDARATLAELREINRVEAALAARKLALIGQWCDLHGVVDHHAGPVLPGSEQLIQVGGDGTAEVAEFAAVELGPALGVRPETAHQMMSRAQALRYRFPQLLALVNDLRVKSWIARKITDLCSELPVETARVMDARVAAVAVGMSGPRLLNLVRAWLLDLTHQDLVAGEHERALRSRHVTVHHDTTGYGVTSVDATLDASDALELDRTINRLAGILGQGGHPEPYAERRALSLGILGKPALALSLLQAALTDELTHDEPCPLATVPGHACGTITVDPAKLLPAAQIIVHLTDTTLTRCGTNDPGSGGPPSAAGPDGPDTTTGTDPVQQFAASISDRFPGRPQHPLLEGPPAPDLCEPHPVPPPSMDAVHEAQAVARHESERHWAMIRAGFTRQLLTPAHLREAASTGHLPEHQPDTDDESFVLPDCSDLHQPNTHLGSAPQDSRLPGGYPVGSLTNHGLARIETIGPVLTTWLTQLLRHHRIVVRPVLDPHTIRPVDAYEIPDSIRFAVRLRQPMSGFPYSTTSSRVDLDHTIPYSPDGPAGQTHPGNLAPLSRTEHRAKTHGHWHCLQLAPGILAWTSPHRAIYLTTPSQTLEIHIPAAPAPQPSAPPGHQDALTRATSAQDRGQRASRPETVSVSFTRRRVVADTSGSDGVAMSQ